MGTGAVSEPPKGFVIDESQPPEGFVIDAGESPSFFEKARAGLGLVAGAGATTADAALSVGRSMLAEPVSGLVGASVAPFAGVDKAADVIDKTRETIAGEPFSERGKVLVGALAKGMESVTKAARLPIAGFAGIANLPRGVDKAAESVRSVRDEGIGPSAADAALEATGSPLLATALHTLPTAVATVAGGRTIRPKRAPEAPQPRIEPTIEPVTRPELEVTEPLATVGKPQLDTPVDVTPPDVVPYETVVQAIRKGKTDRVAEQVLPDQNIVESAQRLGVDLNPEHYSTNAGFQDVARALKSQPGSKLQAAEVQAMQRLSSKADELVQDIGGSLDKATVSDTIINDVRTTIDKLSDQAEVAFTAIDKAIPSAARVEAAGIRTYLDSKISDLGGDVSLLSKSEKQLLALVQKKGKGKEVDIVPTYAALDRVRKNVGSGFRNRGPYKNDESGILNQVYGVLAETQKGVAESFGVGELYASANKLVVQRKSIEDVSIQLFGKDLAGSLVPKMQSAATGLSKGDVGRFNKLITAVPAARRGEVAATILGDMFSGGSRRGGELGQGFVATYASLNRNQAAKEALFRYLPAESRQAFDDIGKVLTGIVQANRKPMSNPSGSAGPIIQALESGTVLSRLYEGGRKVAMAEGVSTTVGLPGAGTAGVVGAMLAKKRTPIVVAADEMLSSPAFARSVEKAVAGEMKAANQIIESSPSYKKWHSQLDAETKRKIAAVGFISWVASENQ